MDVTVDRHEREHLLPQHDEGYRDDGRGHRRPSPMATRGHWHLGHEEHHCRQSAERHDAHACADAGSGDVTERRECVALTSACDCGAEAHSHGWSTSTMGCVTAVMNEPSFFASSAPIDFSAGRTHRKESRFAGMWRQRNGGVPVHRR